MKAALSVVLNNTFRAILMCLFYHSPVCFGSETIVLGAIGDSITVACNAASLGDNPGLSWSTGTDNRVNSHLKKLAIWLKSDVQGVNLAKTGARVGDLGSQVASLVSHMPDFVTVEIGANDLCAWKEDYAAKILQFGIELRSNISKLIENNPKVRILLASIPDIYGLWEIGSRRSECQLRWDLLGFCSPLLSSNTTTQDRAAFVERWRIVNNTIASVADSFPQNVVFNSAVASARISREHMSSIDCFHPSIQGQNLLSERAWPFMMSLTR